MTALPSTTNVGGSCLPERKITLRFARFGAVCMHCVAPTNTGGSSTSVTVPEPQCNNYNDKLRLRKPVVPSFNPKNLKSGLHHRSFSATTQGSLSSKGCAVLAAFDGLCLNDTVDDCPTTKYRNKFRRLFSTSEMPPTPVLAPTRKEPEIPAFSDLDCDTITPSSESMSPPPLDL